MVRVEALVVHIDCLQKLIQVVPFVGAILVALVAHGALHVLYEPRFDTFAMENVITVEHPANRRVLYRLQADEALLGEELAGLEANEHLLNVHVLHLLEPLVQNCLALLFPNLGPFVPSKFKLLRLRLISWLEHFSSFFVR